MSPFADAVDQGEDDETPKPNPFTDLDCPNCEMERAVPEHLFPYGSAMVKCQHCTFDAPLWAWVLYNAVSVDVLDAATPADVEGVVQSELEAHQERKSKGNVLSVLAVLVGLLWGWWLWDVLSTWWWRIRV